RGKLFFCHNENMLEVHAILHRQRCYENMTEKTGTLSDAYREKVNNETCKPASGADELFHRSGWS
ncbi:hypothetical protein, partial [Bacteroides caecimuris]|uniref:hypothetical protein n=1 Tax=Bacteroides caecimuris TaxID=1796613 RepID=UPI0025B73BD1